MKKDANTRCDKEKCKSETKKRHKKTRRIPGHQFLLGLLMIQMMGVKMELQTRLRPLL